MDTVAIIIVNWNEYDESAECISTLKKLDYPDYEIVVVDNGSTDGSGDRLREEFESVEFVSNDRNRGFGGGCNAGIDHIISADIDYVLLLNHDARVTGEALRELVSVQKLSGAEIVGATIASGDKVEINDRPAYFPDMFFYSGYRKKLPFVFESADNSTEKRWFETARVEGACVLLTREILRHRKQTTGHYLDNSLFMYGEEIELGMWCRDNDVSSVVATNAVVHHDSESSSSRAFQLYYLTRNRVIIAHRYMSGSGRILFDVAYPMSRLIIAVRLLLNGQEGVGKAILMGMIDGYRNVTGKTW